MKTISVVIPTYNEEDNVLLAYERVKAVFVERLKPYNFHLIFIDNYSTDKTRSKIEELCKSDNRVKAIFNAKNFGFDRSVFYGLCQSTGDATVLLFADMQDPPEMIPNFVEKWENGAKIVCGVRTDAKESKMVFMARKAFYKIAARISDINHIKGFDGFGLYDASFIQTLSQVDDSLPYLRGIVAELGGATAYVTYKQENRKNGKSKFNFLKMYDLALLGLTSYSKIPMHLVTILGFSLAVICAFISIVLLILKIFNWNSFPLGSAATQIGMFFLGSIQIFFIGFVGEYIVNMNARLLHHPVVIEERRINFKEREIENRGEN